MLLSRQPKFVCMLPPKTGTSSVVAMLKLLLDGAPVAEDTGFEENILSHPGLSRQGPTRFLPRPEELHKHSLAFRHRQGYATYMTCRNPYSRAVSVWAHSRAVWYPGITFQAFLRHPSMSTFSERHWMALPQYAWASAACPEHVDMGFDPRIDYLIRCEDIEGSVRQLPWVPDDFKTLKINNTAYDKESWRNYYEQGDEQLVAELYRADFDLFGYSPDLEDA